MPQREVRGGLCGRLPGGFAVSGWGFLEMLGGPRWAANQAAEIVIFFEHKVGLLDDFAVFLWGLRVLNRIIRMSGDV